MGKINSIVRALLKKRPKAQTIRSNNKIRYGVIIVTSSGYVKGLNRHCMDLTGTNRQIQFCCCAQFYNSIKLHIDDDGQ